MLALSVCTSALAQERTPVETFISNVKSTNTFVPVSDIWAADKNFDQTDLLKIVTQGQPLSINYMNLAAFMQLKSTAINLVLPGIGSGSYTIELARYDFLTNDFQVHEMGANGADKMVSYTPGLYYSGVVKGIPGSVAAFSFFNNEVYGIFSIPGEGNYVVAPNTMVGKDYDYNQHYLLYNDADLKIKDLAPRCGTDNLPEIKRANKTTTTLNNKVYNNCTEVRCFETADFAMYTKKGSTANATNHITAMFNNKSTIYRNEGVPIVLKYVQVNTATDAYQSLALSSSTWLNKFGDVTMNTMHGCDVATLFSTKADASGFAGMGGVAWLGLMCHDYIASDHAGPYAFCNIDNTTTLTSTAFPTYSWDVEVSTHEMGHSVGSPHTHACVWNPPARNTAIDSCYHLEGSCIAPAGRPNHTTKGTIMSYCHLVDTVGINFTNGFGIQPADTIKFYLANTFGGTCGADYNPSVALARPSRTISANRECTDLTGVTYYWNDNNTADHTDDTLVLMMMKNGNNIGTLNSSGFAVTANTIAGYGGGTGGSIITFPTGTPGITAAYMQIAMKRYWQVTPTANPTTPVEVIFPFLPADTADVSGSIAGGSPITHYRMYKVNNPVDPNPANHFPSATASNFNMYTYGTTASTTTWSLSTAGTTQLAHMKMTNLNGGGTGFYSYSATGVENVNEGVGGISVYPNPTSNEWYIATGPAVNETLSLELYTADGRVAHAQQLQAGITNVVNAATLAKGVYFYRIIGGSNVYTGNLIKN